MEFPMSIKKSKKPRNGNGSAYATYSHLIEKNSYDIESLSGEISEIKVDQKDTKHEMAIINERIGGINEKVIIVSKDIEWLKKYFWMVMTASMGTFVTLVLQFIFKNK